MGRLHCVQPLTRTEFIGANHSPHLIIQNFSRGTGNRIQSRVYKDPQVVINGQPKGFGTMV